MQLTDRADWKYYACFKKSKMQVNIKSKPVVALPITHKGLKTDQIRFEFFCHALF
jgi:hypothetical protein